MNKKLDFRKMPEGEALYSIGMRLAEKDGKKGVTLPVPGKPGETFFIEASDERPDAIVASPDKRDAVKGSKAFRCHDCRRKVWLAPTGQELHKGYPDVPIICLHCMIKQTEEVRHDY